MKYCIIAARLILESYSLKMIINVGLFFFFAWENLLSVLETAE